MKLNTKLTLYLSLIIVVGLSGVGYLHIRSRQNILNNKMKVGVKSIGQTTKVSLEKSGLLNDSEYVRELIDSIEKYEKTVGVLVYHQGKDHIFRTHSLEEEYDQADLAEQLIEFYRRKGAIVKETAHAFRNRITAIGGLSQRVARLAKSTDLAKDSRVICREMLYLEKHLERFERYMDL